jgi:hypothetical protein
MPTTGWQCEIQSPVNTLFFNEENNYSDIQLYINELTKRNWLNFMRVQFYPQFLSDYLT